MIREVAKTPQDTNDVNSKITRVAAKDFIMEVGGIKLLKGLRYTPN
jgi:hypothetical protein